MADSSDRGRQGGGKPKRKVSNKPRAAATGGAKTKGHLEVIEQLLHQPVPVEKDGELTKMPAISAIIYVLLKKSLAGDRKAERALQRYEAHALQSRAADFEIVFVDSDYTRAFATSRDGNDV